MSQSESIVVLPLPPSLDPAPLLDAFENYAGSFLDLDRELELDGDDLRACRDAIAEGLRHSGLLGGDRVLLRVGNGPGFPASLAAVLKAGGAPILLHFETPPAELNRLGRAYDARFLLSDESTIAEFPIGAAAATTIDFRASMPFTLYSLRAAKPDADNRFPSLPAVPLHPTSGTTGVPKMAIRHATAAIAEAVHYRDTMGITADDTILCVVPMSHAYGFGTAAMLPLVSGARVVSSRRFQPRVVVRAFRSQRITTFPAVPAMLHLLLLAADGPIDGLPRRVLSAGAPLPEPTANAFRERAGAPVQSLYGSTETGGISVDVKPVGPGLPGCVGPAMEGVSVEVRPVEETADWKKGTGRVWVGSDSMMAGYLTREGIDRSSIIDGWFANGDLGFLDDARRIHLVGRESEVINVFGMKVVPSEVETVIRRVPGVADVKVYAGAHRSGSQIVKAAVAGEKTLDTAAIREHCARELVAYKRPEIIARVDALPRTATGKIIRDQLP